MNDSSDPTTLLSADDFQAELVRNYTHLYKTAEAARNADHQGQIESLRKLLDIAMTSDSGQARVIASVLASCYNGYRVKVDLTDLRLLDADLFEHVINVLRLDNSPVQEVHNYFDNGGAVWEQMIKRWGLEKPQRASPD